MSKTKYQYEIIHGAIEDFDELRKFAQAQMDVITQLSKKLSNLEGEKKHLEQLLVQNVPLVGPQAEVIEKEGVFSSEEEAICREQLHIFKIVSQERELTLEETKKVEIYSKILMSFKQEPKKAKSSVDGMSTPELLRLVESEKV